MVLVGAGDDDGTLPPVPPAPPTIPGDEFDDLARSVNQWANELSLDKRGGKYQRHIPKPPNGYSGEMTPIIPTVDLACFIRDSRKPNNRKVDELDGVGGSDYRCHGASLRPIAIALYGFLTLVSKGLHP